MLRNRPDHLWGIVYLVSVSTKEILMEVAEKLSSEATLSDAISELEFRQAVEEGLAALDRGERIPLEEARQRISECVTATAGGGSAGPTAFIRRCR